MADSIDQKIVLSSDTQGGEAVNDTINSISKETSEAAKHATNLLKVISELMKQFEGNNSEAANQLKKDLEDLARIINTLDVERIKHLDGVLVNIEKSWKKLAESSTDEAKDGIDELKEGVKDLDEDFKKIRDIKIKVSPEENGIDTMMKQIDAIKSANGLLDTLGKMDAESWNNLNIENATEITAIIGEMAEEVENLSEENVPKLDAAFQKFVSTVSKLPSEAQKSLKSFNLEVLKTKIDGLTNSVKKTKELATSSEGTAIGVAYDALSGNLEGIGNHLTSIIEKTKLWGNFTAKVGLGKAAAAIGLVSIGIKSAISAAQKYIDLWQSEKREARNFTTNYIDQASSASDDNREFASRVRNRNKGLEDAKLQAQRTKETNARQAKKANLDIELQSKLATTFDPNERDRITKEYERKKSAIDYEETVTQYANSKTDRERNIADLEAQLRENEKQGKSVKQLRAQASANASAATSDIGKLNAWEMVLDKVGITSQLDDQKSAAENAQAAEEAVTKKSRELEQEKKDLIAKIEAAKLAQEAENTEIAKITAERKVQLATQKAEDVERKREIAALRRSRRVTLEDRDYDERDAEFEMDQNRRRRSGAYASEIRNAEYKRNQYALDLETNQRNLDDFKKTIEGKKEEELSNEEVAERDRLEGLVLRDKRNLRSATNTVEDLKANRAERIAEFREGTRRQGNRLSEMGLGGDVVNSFAKDTAGNTKMLVELTRTLVENSKSMKGQIKASDHFNLKGGLRVGARWNQD